jgi:hypothetical protein
VQEDLRRAAEPLGDMYISSKGKHLGCTLGPSKGDSSWQGALEKATKRVGEWDWAPVGLLFASQVWNTLVASLFGFVAQLERPPPRTSRSSWPSSSGERATDRATGAPMMT